MNALPRYFAAAFPTPVGVFALAVDSAGALVGAVFGRLDRLRAALEECELQTDQARTAAVRAEVEDYFAARRRQFTSALAPAGSAFQQRVWRALQEIPFGETRSYGQIAKALRTSARAVGRANATNPLCLLIPCHRVIAKDGSLSGYAFGPEIKRRLLEHEGALSPGIG